MSKRFQTRIRPGFSSAKKIFLKIFAEMKNGCIFAKQNNNAMKSTVKPHTKDCFGNSFSSMTIEQLIELRNTISLEVKTYSFYKETIRYQKKQRATLEFLFELTVAQ